MHPGFVDLQQLYPSLQLDIRYAGRHNLAGHPLAGYNAPRALMTREAAAAFGKAVEAFEQLGYGILVYDTYRPQKAVTDFVTWSRQPEDNTTKAEFYPRLEKASLFPQGYIALHSGHSRGSTIDLTLTKDGNPIDMGTCFDYMDELSHHDCTQITPQQLQNRETLRRVMLDAGFDDYDCEWWHYRLHDEPYPDTYFDFDINP